MKINENRNVETLRTAFALGATRGIHVVTEQRTDLEIQPWIIAQVFKKLIEAEKPDLLLFGKQAIDDDFGHTGQMVSASCRLPIANFASKITVDDSKTQRIVEVIREIDGGLQTVRFASPGVVTCDLRLNIPRFATLPNIMKAKQKKIETLSLESLGLDLGSKLEILSVEEPPVRQGGVILEDVDKLIHALKNEVNVL